MAFNDVEISWDDKLQELFDSDDDEWTEWECTFIRDLESKGLDYDDLSELQMEKVAELYEKMTEGS